MRVWLDGGVEERRWRKAGHASILVGRKHTRNSYPVKLGVADR